MGKGPKLLKAKPAISAAIIAALCFGGLNLLLDRLYCMSKNVASGSLGSHSTGAMKNIVGAVKHLNSMDELSIESAVDGFRASEPPANVVLMGSSLMMFPFWAVDKNVEPSLRDQKFQYHRSMELQNKLRSAGLANAVVYDMATPLQMISDTYLYMDRLFIGRRTPHTVVLGVSPRDFWDSEFPQPGQTLNFMDQVGLVDCGPYWTEYLPRLHDKALFAMSQGVFLYDKRSYIQRFLTDKMMRRFGKKEVSPLMAGGTRFAFGIGRYKERYQGISILGIEPQMRFLDKICDLCDRRNIRLILLNMPLPDINRQLMSPQFYRQYQTELCALAEDRHVQFLELADVAEFKQDFNYSDAAHMNRRGGNKLIEHILPAVIAETHSNAM